MSRQFIRVPGAFVLVCALTLLARAQDRCSSAGVAGTYAVTCHGFLTPGPSAPMLPAALLARAVADKDGNWTGTAGTLSIGGSIVTLTVQSVGPAQVNPDCTGTITYAQTIDGQPGPNSHFNFIVEKNSEIIDGISSDPGTAFSCTLTRQNKQAENR